MMMSGTGSPQINWGDVTFLDSLTNCTFFAVVLPSGSSDGYGNLIRKDGTWTPIQRNGSTAQFHSAIWATSIAGETTNLAFSASTLIRVSGVRNGTSYTLRANGSSTSFTCGSAGLPNTANPLVFFSKEGGGERWFSSGLAEVAFWSVALTADEIVSLEKGFRPSRVRPSALLFYSDLTRTMQDRRRGTAVSSSADVTAYPHPAVY
jgi:hypothetical protein